jgi:hypothetical protein
VPPFCHPCTICLYSIVWRMRLEIELDSNSVFHVSTLKNISKSKYESCFGGILVLTQTNMKLLMQFDGYVYGVCN